MPYAKFPLKPGVIKDDTSLAAKGFWVDADGIRFVRGLPETQYGYESVSSSSLLGLSRGTYQWADNSRNPFASFGTNLRLYAMDIDGNVTDITPIISRTNESISFTTTNGSSTVTMTRSSHGLFQFQKFQLLNASTPTVGGVTINGTYTVATVVDANNITFVAAQTASSSAGPTASTCDYYVSLAPGQVDGLGGLGFGAGGFGLSGFGNTSVGLTLYPRTYSESQWGQNLIANPRGGGIYEWAPNVTATELTTNGTFTGSATGWVLNAGWAYGANNIIATAASAAFTQSETLLPGAWYLCIINVSAYTSGTIQGSIGGVNFGSAINAAGKYFLKFNSGAGGSQILAFTGAVANLTVNLVSLMVETTAEQITNAPTNSTSAFVTTERILVSCGNPNTAGNFDAMRISWTDTQNNQTWTPAASNLAGSFTLSNGSRIVRGMPGTNENVVLTDKTLYSMRYVPDPSVVYNFTEIAGGAGLISPNALCTVGGIFYWIAPDGTVWQYDGSTAQQIECPMARDFFDNLADGQQDKIFAFGLTSRDRVEVWFIYPDIRDGNECSRYLIYHVTESTREQYPVWAPGKTTRTSWLNIGVFPYPLAVDTSGNIWYQEKGFSANGGPRQWFITSAYSDVGDGDSHMRLVNYQPDSQGQGGYTLTLNGRIRNLSGINVRSFGPYNVLTNTGKVPIRFNGQEIQRTYAGNAAPSFWRLGSDRFDIEQTQRRR